MLTYVKGVAFCNEDGTSRARIIESMSLDDQIILERDSFNQYDENAIKVCVIKSGQSLQIGFIERSLASILSPEIKRGRCVDASVESCGFYMDRPYCEIDLKDVHLD